MKTVLMLKSVLIAFCVLLTPISFALPVYTVTDLGCTSCMGLDINESGQVVGTMSLGGYSSAFLYSNGVVHNLGTAGGAPRSNGNGLNNLGKVTGHQDWVSSPGPGFIGDLSGLTLLRSPLLERVGTVGVDINDSNQVAGYEVAGGRYSAFMYENGVMNYLGTTLGGQDSKAHDINNNGQMTGSSTTLNGHEHAFLYNNGTMTDLGTLGGTVSVGWAINDLGHVTGGALLADDNAHAFLYADGVMIDLGTLGGSTSHGWGINDHGQVTGRSYNSAGEHLGFLYSNGSMFDLNDLIDPLAGLTLLEGRSINNSGQIVAWGYLDGYTSAYEVRSFILTPSSSPEPVPEPSMFTLLGLGLIGFALRYRRRCSY